MEGVEGVKVGLGCCQSAGQVGTERLRSAAGVRGLSSTWRGQDQPSSPTTNTGVCCLNRIIIKYILTNCWIRTAMGEYIATGCHQSYTHYN